MIVPPINELVLVSQVLGPDYIRVALRHREKELLITNGGAVIRIKLDHLKILRDAVDQAIKVLGEQA